MFIEIDLSTIKKNPDAGRTTTEVSTGKQIYFEIEGGIPEVLRNHPLVWISCEVNGKSFQSCKGELASEEALPILEPLKEKYVVRTQVKNGFETIRHMPIPEYSFKYLNPTVLCMVCKTEVNVSSIDEDCNDDGCYKICPNCFAVESFEELKYETIIEALKRK